MTDAPPQFACLLAETEADLCAAQRLRYEVFVEELGGDGPLVDHDARLERDAYDVHYDHMLLVDTARPGPREAQVVGVYRLMPGDRAAAAGGFYCAEEYDLTPLIASGRRLLELGRSCVHPAYRGGAATLHLWSAVAAYVAERRLEILFGVASFHGIDPAALAQPLAYLHHNHLAPEALRVRSRVYQTMDLCPPAAVDRAVATLAIPALIKGYLRLGGRVGDGAFVDHAFNTTDVCLIMDTAQMTERQRTLFARGLPG